jgi:hypothetical protein
MDDWKVATGKHKPLELADAEWVEIRCFNGAVNQQLAGKALWHSKGEARLPYWAVTHYRTLTPSAASK